MQAGKLCISVIYTTKSVKTNADAMPKRFMVNRPKGIRLTPKSV
jgi:hypothetical protein